MDPDPGAHGGHRVSDCVGSGRLVGEMHWLFRSAGVSVSLRSVVCRVRACMRSCAVPSARRMDARKSFFHIGDVGHLVKEPVECAGQCLRITSGTCVCGSKGDFEQTALARLQRKRARI